MHQQQGHGQTAVKAQLRQNNQRLLQEIDQLARQLAQQSMSPQVKQAAQQIAEYCQLIQGNEQVEHQLS